MGGRVPFTSLPNGSEKGTLKTIHPYLAYFDVRCQVSKWKTPPVL